MSDGTLIIALSIVGAIVFAFFIAFVAWYNKQGQKRNRELLETVTSLNRGTKSEQNLVLKFLKNGISSKAIFHDLYIQKPNGEYSQIDLVIATKAGIIVIEDKYYGGWIFGNGKHDNWTKVMAFGDEKYKFYNPIKQNAWHINYLQKALRESIPFYSVIVFSGSCKLRDISNIPDGTFVIYHQQVLQIVNTIMNGEPVNYKDRHNIIKVLKRGVENGNDVSIRERHRVHVAKQKRN
ncbi:MAG: NERD domain-containing protein [Treponema sp.]|nr:NERD domain-containing protein [Treponema sp.]